MTERVTEWRTARRGGRQAAPAGRPRPAQLSSGSLKTDSNSNSNINSSSNSDSNSNSKNNSSSNSDSNNNNNNNNSNGTWNSPRPAQLGRASRLAEHHERDPDPETIHFRQ